MTHVSMTLSTSIYRVASRVVLIPFYTTQKSQQLSGPDRDKADKDFRAARRAASGAASAIISLGPTMENEVSTEFPLICERAECISPTLG